MNQYKVENGYTSPDLRLRGVQNSLKSEALSILEGAGKIVILDFILGFLLIFRSIAVAGLPLSALVLLVYVTFRFFQKSSYQVKQSVIISTFFMLGAAYLLLVSVEINDASLNTSLQRLVRIGSVVLFALLIADRRVNFRSFIYGFTVGLIFNAVGFYSGVAPADYGSYLTGWIQDKNVAGLYYAIVSMSLYALAQSRWQRFVILLIFLPLLWETGSRTSIGAFLIGMLWFHTAQRMNFFFKVILGAFTMWLFEWAQTRFSDSEVFGDRTGTDWFRERIDEAALTKVQGAPWYGRGLGEATVELGNGRSQFFHNSYWTLLIEGGWPWLILVVGLSILTVFVWKQKTAPRNIVAEPLMIILFVCSWRLGEVLLTMPWGLAMGIALYYLAEKKEDSFHSLMPSGKK